MKVWNGYGDKLLEILWKFYDPITTEKFEKFLHTDVKIVKILEAEEE